MERTVTISLEKAREWYNKGNDSLKEVALQAFSEEELQVNFKVITSLYEACNVLNLDSNIVECQSFEIAKISKASAAMFKLNIIRKALNLGQDLHLTKNPEDSHIYYPYNPFITKSSTYYKSDISSGKMEIIGKIKSEGEEYYVLGGRADVGGVGFGDFNSSNGVGVAYIDFGVLGCANKEIAEHFGKYFGMLITEAKYGDLLNFKIV